MLQRYLMVVAALAAVALAAAPANGAVAINGTCGVHIGTLVRGFDHEWHMRLGVRRGVVGGPAHCHGYVRVKGGRGAIASLLWHKFGKDRGMPTWRWNFVGSLALNSALTAQGCKSAAAGLVTVLASDGLAFPGWVALGSSIGCAKGVYGLGQLLPGTDNGPARLVK